MESLKVDRTRLKKISSYAKMRGYTPQRIYQLIDEGQLDLVVIDGVKFIKV